MPRVSDKVRDIDFTIDHILQQNDGHTKQEHKTTQESVSIADREDDHDHACDATTASNFNPKRTEPNVWEGFFLAFLAVAGSVLKNSSQVLQLHHTEFRSTSLSQ